MDAGLAAVLGALAGSAATIGTAFVTSRSQRETARLTARAEHQRQRREPRHDTYKAFISSTSQLRDQLEKFENFDLYPDSITDATVQHYNDTANELKSQWVEVALVGPANVGASSKKVEQLAHKTALQVNRLQWFIDQRDDQKRDSERSAIELSAFELALALDNFITVAQAALDDDGSL
ncbi:hypothetical protein GCM10009601_26830 [Streptomyces thermospinosisporus]|uniref:Uncharacterized protein n=1 Tax=Streptomyces thermospinosisporus TaxID=161482 RepID=A0ABN1YVK6_9ACTN